MEPMRVIYGLSIDGVTIRYVGFTTRGLKWRMRRHREDSTRDGGASQRPVCKWIRKHGHAVVPTVLEIVPDDADIHAREIAWIEELKTFTGDRCGGLNTTRGGEGTHGWRHTPEQRAKISAAQVGRTYPARVAVGAARRRAAREAHCQAHGHVREEVVTASGRRACAVCMRNAREGKTSWNAGQSWSPELRAKMAASSLGQVPWNVGRNASEAEVESNRAAQLARYADEQQRAKGRANLALASHVRWHVNRGKVGPDCPHCASRDDADRRPALDAELGE